MPRSDQETVSFTWELLPGEEIHECYNCGPLRRLVEADPAARYGLIVREWHVPACAVLEEPQV